MSGNAATLADLIEARRRRLAIRGAGAPRVLELRVWRPRREWSPIVGGITEFRCTRTGRAPGHPDGWEAGGR